MFRLLLWVHSRIFASWLRSTWRDSPLLLLFLLVLICGYVGVGYWLFYSGLSYLYHFPLFGGLLTERVLFLIFGFFFLMLVFSNVVIGYTTLFRNRETAWFLTLPLTPRAIFQWKFFEALVVSSWALMFLSAPLMLAYGRVHQVGLGFFLKVAALYLPFVALPAVVGTAGSLVLARLFSSRRLKVLLLCGGAAALLALLLGLRPSVTSDAAVHGDVISLDTVLRHTRLSINPYIPSAWVTRAILAWSDRLNPQGYFYFGLVLSNALMGLLVLFEGVGRGFHGAWVSSFSSRSGQSHRRLGARRAQAWRPSLLERALEPVRRWSPPAAALALKDLRLFWRDPAQWSQFLIFFGLLCIYVANLRNVVATFQSEFWATVISYLNLAACSLTLSTLTTRFVFPQFSLEGRRIWILGLAPFGLRKVLAQKFALAYVLTLTITTGMMIASSLLLHLPAAKVLFFAVTISIMCAALCGLSVGLGAVFPNFKEDNPSKIVSGFGGTVCLVLSFLYVTVTVAVLALPDLLALSGYSSSVVRTAAAQGFALALSLLVFGAPLLSAGARVKRLEI